MVSNVPFNGEEGRCLNNYQKPSLNYSEHHSASSNVLNLSGELWDSIPDSIDVLPVPDWHREELERRLATANADPDASIPWEEIKRRLHNKS